MLLDTEKLTFGADLSSHAAKAISTLRPVFRLYILALDFAQLPSRTGLPHSLSLRSFSFPLSNVHQGSFGRHIWESGCHLELSGILQDRNTNGSYMLFHCENQTRESQG